MTPEQEEKFKAWYYKPWEDQPVSQADGYEKCWQACLESNGIGAEPPATESSAPAWVIDMMRTGNPVRCKVWNANEWTGDETFIDGYRIGAQYPYMGSQRWRHAEPIPTWKPKDGEAVLFRHRDNGGSEWKTALGAFSKGNIYFGGHRMSALLLRFKQFDGDYEQIGLPWS